MFFKQRLHRREIISLNMSSDCNFRVRPKVGTPKKFRKFFYRSLLVGEVPADWLGNPNVITNQSGLNLLMDEIQKRFGHVSNGG